MAANKEKQNIRFKQTSRRIQNKVRYDGFTKDEVKIIKTQKKLEQFEKDLNDFWKRAPRRHNRSVNWDLLSENELDYFDYIYKQHENLNNRMSKFEKQGFNIDKIMYMFMKLNINSVSF